MRGTKLYGIVAAAFMAGAFIASPELRAYAANTVFSSDIVDGEVKSADIATNAVKSAEIAADAVGASELKGVTKLMFFECSITDNSANDPGAGDSYGCSASGTDTDDNVIVTNNGNSCYMAVGDSSANSVSVILRNTCASSVAFGTGTVSIVVYDT